MALPDLLDSGATRTQLKTLCTQAIVTETSWGHRYSANAQRQVGELWALLSAGCEFEVVEDKTDDKRLCVRVLYKGEDSPKVAKDNGIYEYEDLDIYFLPQPQNISGGDWYL